jgi:hypothetical protein
LNVSSLSRPAALLLAALFATAPAAATPRAVEGFDADTWGALRGAKGQAAVVVFSATLCPTCPGVIEQLTRELVQRKLKAVMMAVVTDVAPGEQDAALLRDSHYRQVDRLFAFDGQAQALRYAVDPGWRGVTPYVVFLSPQGAPPMVVTGTPSAAVFDVWAKGIRRAGH